MGEIQISRKPTAQTGTFMMKKTLHTEATGKGSARNAYVSVQWPPIMLALLKVGGSLDTEERASTGMNSLPRTRTWHQVATGNAEHVAVTLTEDQKNAGQSSASKTNPLTA